MQDWFFVPRSSLHRTSFSSSSSFLLSLLAISHRLFPSSQHGAGTPSRISVTAALVSGAVNQVFLWIGASFTQSGFHCFWQRRPGNQQVHRQVCRADDKACWRTAAAASRSFKLFMSAVMPWGRPGTACSIFLRQTKLLHLKFYYCILKIFFDSFL